MYPLLGCLSNSVPATKQMQTAAGCQPTAVIDRICRVDPDKGPTARNRKTVGGCTHGHAETVSLVRDRQAHPEMIFADDSIAFHHRKTPPFASLAFTQQGQDSRYAANCQSPCATNSGLAYSHYFEARVADVAYQFTYSGDGVGPLPAERAFSHQQVGEGIQNALALATNCSDRCQQ